MEMGGQVGGNWRGQALEMGGNGWRSFEDGWLSWWRWVAKLVEGG